MKAKPDSMQPPIQKKGKVCFRQHLKIANACWLQGQPHTITGEHDMQLRLFRAACSELTLHAADNSADSETVRAALQRREVRLFSALQHNRQVHGSDSPP